jgi:Rrf2 family protein
VRLELTKRADYAIRTVLALARSTADGGRMSVRRVASEQAVPERFLPQVMRDLVRAGIVEGTVGRAGGYRLARPSSQISLLDVVEAVEGDSRRRVCILRGGPCALKGVCDVHAVFAAAQEDVLSRLGGTTVLEAIRTDHARANEPLEAIRRPTGARRTLKRRLAR